MTRPPPSRFGGRPLIGRADDVERVRGLLVEERARLVTLVGPGGVGKTSLALAVACRVQTDYADGVVCVDLSQVHEPALVLPSIAQALGVREVAGRPLALTLAESVGDRALLLVLDNLEQVTGAAGGLGKLLAACPNLSLLASSREPLALSWEQLFQVAPLGCPPAAATTWEAICASPAVSLFVQQARAVRPNFALTASNAAAVADICRRLDGLPLAIELAAARTRVLSPEAMLVQLRLRPLQLLSGGPRDAPDRHRTLREAIAWSVSLLEPSQQALFRQLSVFVGGCTLEAVEAVVDDPRAAADLESLLDKHLLTTAGVQDELGDDVRFRQLETIREFGSEQLEAAGEACDARLRHARYLADMVERTAAGLYGPHQQLSIERLLHEHNNIRAALDWCIASSTDRGLVELGLRLAGPLWLFWRVRGFVAEGRARLTALLAAAGPVAAPGSSGCDAQGSTVALARALHAAGYLAFAQGAADDAEVLLTASLKLGREIGDPWSRGYALQGLGHAALLRGEFPMAQSLYAERLLVARAQQDDYGLGQALNALGEVARCEDRPTEARDFYEQSLVVRRRLGDTRGVAMGVSNLGHVALADGDVVGARQAFAEGLRLSGQLGHQYGEALCLSGLAGVGAAERRWVTAARLLGASTAALERVGSSLEPPDRRAYERTLAAVRAALGATFGTDFDAGRDLAVADAAELGLADGASDAAVPLSDSDAVARAGASSDVELLSPREREVARLIARGRTSHTIAQELVITKRTADTHAAHIRDKLGLRSRAEIAAWATRHGLR